MPSFASRAVRRRALTAAVLSALLTAAGCGAPANAPPAAAVVTTTATAEATPVAASAVTIKDFKFGPPAITVPAGTTVTWTNTDIDQHTTTAQDKTFNSPPLDSGKSFSFTFNNAGTYHYLCVIHPYMTGIVVVTGR